MAIHQFNSSVLKTQVTLFVKTTWNQVLIYELPLERLSELQTFRKQFRCETVIRRNVGTQYTLYIQYPNDHYIFIRPTNRLRELFALASSHTTCMCYWIKQSNRTVFYSTNTSRRFNRMEYCPPLLDQFPRG